MSRRAFALGVLLSAMALSTGVAQDAPGPPVSPGTRLTVSVEQGRLTAILEDAALLAVLEEVSARTQVAIVPAAGLEGDVISARLKQVALDMGLRTLLKDYDTFFYYRSSGAPPAAALAGVWVYPRGAAATLRPVPLDIWGGVKDLETAMADHDPAVRERAYEALMSRPDRASRNLVMLAIRGANEPDQELRERVLSTALSKGIEIPREVLTDLVRAGGSDGIRLLALEALTGEPSAREAAVAALTDPSELVRERAKEFLIELDSLSRRRDQ